MLMPSDSFLVDALTYIASDHVPTMIRTCHDGEDVSPRREAGLAAMCGLAYEQREHDHHGVEQTE